MWGYHRGPGKRHKSCYTSVFISCLSAMGSRWDGSVIRVLPFGFASSLALQAYARSRLLHFCQLPGLQWESKLAGAACLLCSWLQYWWAVARPIKGIAALKCKMEHFPRDLGYRDSERRCCQLLRKEDESLHFLPLLPGPLCSYFQESQCQCREWIRLSGYISTS